MKFTKNKDGQLRATINVPFRVGRETLIAFLALRVTQDSAPLSSRRALLAALKQEVGLYGETRMDYWTDENGNDESRVVRAYAAEQVSKLFPELQ